MGDFEGASMLERKAATELGRRMTGRRDVGPRKDQQAGSWWFVVDLGPDPKTGKRRQARRRGFPTKTAAQASLDQIRTAMRRGEHVASTRATVGAYLESWLAGSLRTSGPRLSTVFSYERNLRKHVIPRIGAIRLTALAPDHLNQLYGELLAGGRLDGTGGLSARTVRYCHQILRRALQDAAKTGLVLRNAADLASPPTSKAARAPEMATWTPDELRAFLESFKRERLFPLFRLAAMTAMRRGEVCGLRWRDVDLESDEPRASIVRQIVTVNHQCSITDVKTDRSRRTIDLDPETVAVLRTWRAAQGRERLALGPAFVDSGLVFTEADGHSLHPDSVAKVFERRVARSGLPRIRFHDLRHTHATHLIAAGVHAKVVAERLGHASEGFTLARYAHVLKGLQAGAAVAVAALVDGRNL